jgi:hypothetical protein
MLIRRTIPLVIGLALLAGCSSTSGAPADPAGADGPPPAGAPEAATGQVGDDGAGDAEAATDLLELDVCGLVSSEEVAGIVGNPVGEGERLPLVCSWDSATVEDVAVSMGVIPSFGGEDPCEGLGSDDSVEVSGFGSGAFWRFVEATGFNTASLGVCLGDLALDVQLAGARDEATLRSATQELVELAMERL